MCVLLPAWLWLLLGLLPLEIQSRALTLHSFAHRLTLSRTSKHHKLSFTATMPAASDLPTNFDDLLTQGNRYTIWRSLSHKESLSKLSKPSPDESGVVLQEAPVSQRGSRSRRHANSGGTRGHGHLMRVGCVLGTCQVQNLSHRLYQLIGQSGREDSSPINPRSPHSYG
ncbi:protein ADM2 isoform X1 [Xyrichtys novacula]|uniref:Protein ADM2 isoform X1 n=1 Tax=Xyrichtys novacula TaxID=13765 RepID=A0AAV1F6X9_XYRNO|nr:protein ADM2 isoform X1 [Xyrichtys novacula]